jgi:hypothetical protein
MPPDFEIAIAILDSVTVSIADDIKGICKFKLSDSLLAVITSEGSTEEYCGTNVTSSNVNESLMTPIFNYIYFSKKSNPMFKEL